MLYEKCIHKDAWMYGCEAVGAGGGKPRFEAARGGGHHKFLRQPIPVWDCSWEQWHLFFCSAGVRYRIQ